jgi:hypothetical protein
VVRRKPALSRRSMKLLYVHKKVAKGRTYYYFDLGRDEDGNHILKRLPDVRSHQFAAAYRAAKSQRSKQTGGETAKNFDWLIRIYEKSPEFRSKAENTKRLYARHLAYANESFRSNTGRSWPLSIITPSMSWRCATSTPEAGNGQRDPEVARRAVPLGHEAGAELCEGESRCWHRALEIGEHRRGRKSLSRKRWKIQHPAPGRPALLPGPAHRRHGEARARQHDGGAIRLTQQKTGKTSLIVRFTSALRRSSKRTCRRTSWCSCSMTRASRSRRAAFASASRNGPEGKGHHIVPHGLRKNAVNALLEAECSVAEVSAITGQSLQMVEHYAKERDQAALGRSAILKFEARNKS